MVRKYFNSYYQNEGIGILRISFGILLAVVHGWPTVKGFLDGVSQYPDPLGIGPRLSMGLVGFAELICALVVSLGVFNRLALTPIIISFTVALFVYHSGDPLEAKEMALHFWIVFVVLFITGPGSFRLSALFRSKIRQRKS